MTYTTIHKIPARTVIEVEPKASDGIEAITINHCDYVDVPEPIPKGKGGHPGTAKGPGCTAAWKCKTRIKKHIFGHAAMCKYILHPMKEELDGGLAADAPSAKVARHQASKPMAVSSISTSSPSVPPTTAKSMNFVDEDDPGYLRCSNRVFDGSKDARLDGPELLDLLSDKPIEMEAQNQSQIPGPSSEVAGGGPVAWKFNFSQIL
ncbi:hypothetical protein DEU56DRAFT_757921 [Suillus clintonianus]|uniref:uncharacterized protein n=1 Tax=Suillus clintonianus TaxID=1904413 RepID=UPI001B8844C7|nr:uncharacterized protein DEU56DRAFT_757921 [Suillus clintonianus]KAG2130247.1 hypothetical protein DEU56DRAFT_757921 [Suillus clintonianus]